jgi:APA family basic amino acid/polyamine antiporter
MTISSGRGEPSAMATPAPVFSRKATGFVRLGTPYRTLVANAVNIGITYAAFYFWLVPGNFPHTNLLLSILLTLPFGLAFMTAWGLWAILVPRSGGEYVWLSRAVHPALGFGVSGLTFVSWTFWTGLSGYWASTLIVGPIFSVLGATHHSSTLTDIGAKLQASGVPSWPWAIGVGTALVSLAILTRGMGLYYKIQQWVWHIGLLGLAVGVVLLLVNSQADVKSGFNQLAAAGGFHGNAVHTIERAARAMPTGTTFYGLLGMFGVFAYTAVTSGYIAGEVRTPRRTQLIGCIGAIVVYAAIVLVVLLAMAKGVSLRFNNQAAWVNINDPAHYPVTASPTYMLWMTLLARTNVVLVIFVGIGLVLLGINWAPIMIICASRTLFAWSFDRLLPERVTRVSKSGSPTVALIVITAMGVILITAYAGGSFKYVSPYFALMVAYLIVMLFAMLVPFLPKTRAQYRGSRADIRVAGVPLITITGVGGAILFGIGVYLALTVDGLGYNTTSNLLLTLGSFVVPFALYFVIRIVRDRQGILLSRAYDELPPD